MKISKFFQTVSAVAGICLWCSTYTACAQDEAISTKMFTEGKSWSRIIQVFPYTPHFAKFEDVTVTYTVIRGYKPQSPPPDKIVIEILNPSRWAVPNNRRSIALSPENGNFWGYIRKYGGEPAEGWKKERFKNRLYIHCDNIGSFCYPFLPLPIPWKDSTFLLDNQYIGPPVGVTTKIENNTLKVVCKISTYGYMKSDNKVKVSEDKIIPEGEIHIVFKKREPWAASVWTEAEDLNAFSPFLKLRSPEDK